jgi:hypothetical protein
MRALARKTQFNQQIVRTFADLFGRSGTLVAFEEGDVTPRRIPSGELPR